MLILSEVLQKSPAYFFAHDDELVAKNHINMVEKILAKRLQGVPLAYIFGKTTFYDHTFFVDNNTLIPRNETERLVDEILKRYPDTTQALNLLDLGVGSGAIILSLALKRKNWQCIGTDISAKALRVAQKNKENLKLDNVSFYQGDWFDALKNSQIKTFDIIVSNPPYIAEHDLHLLQTSLPHEPQNALVAGKTGFLAIEKIIAKSTFYLNKKGLIIIEHGYNQADNVHRLFGQAGFQTVFTLKDYNNIERITGAVRDVAQ